MCDVCIGVPVYNGSIVVSSVFVRNFCGRSLGGGVNVNSLVGER